MPYVKVKDLDMFYEQMGSGDPVIFLHSSYSRGLLAFASQILDFQNTYTCYFPDFRGHGRTKCESLEWSTPQLAQDIIAFMDQLNIERAHLIGYSMGANVGLYIVTEHPDRAETLTTIGTGGFCNPSGADEFEPEWLEEHGKQVIIGQMKERHEEAHRGNWQEFMRQSANDWRKYPALTEEQLANIGCPVLIIAGEHDTYAAAEQIIRLASLIKKSECLIVPGGSHRPHMGREHPARVNDRILEFLQANAITQ